MKVVNYALIQGCLRGFLKLYDIQEKIPLSNSARKLEQIKDEYVLVIISLHRILMFLK